MKKFNLFFTVSIVFITSMSFIKAYADTMTYHQADGTSYRSYDGGQNWTGSDLSGIHSSGGNTYFETPPLNSQQYKYNYYSLPQTHVQYADPYNYEY